jgi:LmbE family N-acetylglucosaminyl deacetylase
MFFLAAMSVSCNNVPLFETIREGFVQRRQFLEIAATALAGGAQGQAPNGPAEQVVIERANADQPHRAKVLALITPHLDDGPIFAGGTVAKLLSEGYTGYFIRTSNDEKDSYHLTLGETVLANERDTAKLVKTIGFKKSFDLGYRNHRLDDVSRTELRGRLIFLFRLLKVDTVFSYDPWGHYEENPDHYVTAQAVEAACWMAGGLLDFPEQFEVGLKPQSVSEKYYFARGPQQVNRVVDIESFLAQKTAAIESCETMIVHMVKDFNDSLAQRGLRVPALSGNLDAATREFIQAAFVTRDRTTGGKYGLQYAEEFHYIGPDPSLNDYISRNAQRI